MFAELFCPTAVLLGKNSTLTDTGTTQTSVGAQNLTLSDCFKAALIFDIKNLPAPQGVPIYPTWPNAALLQRSNRISESNMVWHVKEDIREMQFDTYVRW